MLAEEHGDGVRCGVSEPVLDRAASAAGSYARRNRISAIFAGFAGGCWRLAHTLFTTRWQTVSTFIACYKLVVAGARILHLRFTGAVGGGWCSSGAAEVVAAIAGVLLHVFR